MSFLSIKDIVELAKQGYKVDDVKELIALSKEDKPEEDDSKDQEQKPDEGDDTKDQEQKSDEGKNTEDSVDHKRLQELEAKLSEAEKTIAQLQKKNAKENIADASDEEDDSQIFANAMKEFM